MKWYYYLHQNGQLIGKNPIVVDSDPEYFNSPFVQKVWVIDTENRADAWNLLIEAISLKANMNQIKKLALQWGITKDDLPNYINQQGKLTEEQQKSVDKLIC